MKKLDDEKHLTPVVYLQKNKENNMEERSHTNHS